MSFPDLFGGALASFGFAMAFVLVIALSVMVWVAVREVALIIGRGIVALYSRSKR